MARSAKRETEPLFHEKPSAELERLATYLSGSKMFGRYPLVILGAGISYGKVPLLKQLGSWFLAKLQREDLGEKDQWLLGHARAIESGAGSRRQAAEFFSTLQLLEHPYEKIWTDFSAGFLYKGLRFDGLASESGQSFDGLAKRSITPTDAHSILAKLMLTNEVSVISLNFDGLTHQAIRRLADCSVNLHTASEIDRYFCSSDQEYMSAIIKVRGDVFYARCANPSCPLSVGQYPIDRIALEGSGAGEPQCPSCQGKRLRLQFQFPGYRIKEESAIPVLAAAKRYLHNRASAIIVIGLSGRWDRYMLQFLFSLARERQVPLVDVKPFHDKRDEMIAEFKNLYYPTFSPQVPKHGEPQAAFVRIEQTADEFCTFLWSDALGHP